MAFYKFFVFVTSFILINKSTNAQESINYFSDSLKNGAHSKVICVARSKHNIYIGGQSFDSLNYYYHSPSISKIDTSGNTIWSYSVNKQFDEDEAYHGGLIYASAYVQQILYDTNFLFAVCYVPETNITELWKINESNGDLVWKTNIVGSIVFKNADANNVAFAYNIGNDYIYEMVDKRTGQKSFSKIIGPRVESAHYGHFEVEQDGSVYVVKRDSIHKYSSITLSNLVWKTKASPWGYISNLKIENDGFLYFSGNQGSLFAGRLNKTTGAGDWILTAPYTNASLNDDVSDFKVINNYVYLTASHRGYGSSYTAYRLWKIEKNTGITFREIVYNPYWGSWPSASGDYVSANSFDVDSLGNIYVTGYEGGYDSREGIWGICKFNSNGDLIYHTTVFDGASYSSRYSRGAYVFIISNTVYYIGNLQKSQTIPNPLSNYGYSDVYLVATDTSNIFNPFKKRKTISKYQYFSQVKAIAQFSQDKYVVYKQFGKAAVVEMRSAINSNILWSKAIQRSNFLTADKMAITLDNKISISAFGHLRSNYKNLQFDYKTIPDSVYFMIFDSTGSLIQQKRLSASRLQKDFKSIQLYADTNTVLVYSQTSVYNKPNSVHFFNPYKTTFPIGGFEDYTTALYTPIQANQKYLLPISADSALSIHNYVPFNSSSNPLYKVHEFKTVNPYSSGWTDVLSRRIDEKFVAHNITPSDSTTMFIIGKKYSGESTILKYNKNTNTVLWIKSETPNYVIDLAASSINQVYWAGRKNKELIVRSLNKIDGALNWERTFSATGAKTYYPIEQKYNLARRQVTISGYIVDSSTILPTQSVFYLTLDSLGNTITNWIQNGDYNQLNTLNTIEVSQFGQTLIGGALYKDPYGRSGILIQANKSLILDTCGLYPIDFTFNQDLPTSNNVNFTTDNINQVFANSYTWYFGNGDSLVSNGNVTYGYAVGGVYNVKLRYTHSSGCVKEIIKPVIIEIPCGSLINLFSEVQNGQNWQWEVDMGSGFQPLPNEPTYVSNTSSLTIMAAPLNYLGYKFRCKVTTASGIEYSSVYTLRYTNKWLGTVSNSWENPANWSCGIVPNLHTFILINQTMPAPVLNSNATIYNLVVMSGASLTVNSGYTLTVLH